MTWLHWARYLYLVLLLLAAGGLVFFATARDA